MVALASYTGLISQPPFPRADLEHAVAAAPVDWRRLRGRRLLLTGGTGFVGSWLLAALLWADAERDLDLRATVLSRDPGAFARRLPSLADHPRVTLLGGDVKTFVAHGAHELLVHAATHAPAGDTPADECARGQADVEATRHVLEAAVGCRAQRILFTSSGAVYGPPSPDLARVPEDAFAPGAGGSPATSAYGGAKQVSEGLLHDFAARTGTDCVIARCFTFVGPGLPLDAGYAAGDFLGDALRGEPVRVAGDGTPLRSYLHAADLAAWLMTVLVQGRSSRPYNVGSGAGVSVRALAGRIAALADPPLPVHTGEKPVPGAPAAAYVPSVERAHKELGLTVRIGLDDALRRTWGWLTCGSGRE